MSLVFRSLGLVVKGSPVGQSEVYAILTRSDKIRQGSSTVGSAIARGGNVSNKTRSESPESPDARKALHTGSWDLVGSPGISWASSAFALVSLDQMALGKLWQRKGCADMNGLAWHHFAQQTP